jgi:hypothetical protein
MESIGPILGDNPSGIAYGEDQRSGSAGAGRKVRGGIRQHQWGRSYCVPFVEIISVHCSVEATDEISMFRIGSNVKLIRTHCGVYGPGEIGISVFTGPREGSHLLRAP